ncbi:Arylsulfatase A [Actinopolymorpha cephalotaxi]|uniref:Arylsulfatase A n=1 Tax=Actinopolymorpha cephalotaxi TaxID=504797 RepID=A0A1I3B9H4_9ACTN|nr:sulfatase [Actinopolymorpha cephalotaxi]NYH86813.1 arylsulfatase A-like enzyme [Actinopolymorpha cephalotaxi]SFH58957.1 Arylsulfatase A [Actinopolymorpha cephalotaxi]
MSDRPNNQPNIVLIVGEDIGRIAGCYGDDYVRTPNLDRLAARGCRYDEAYSTYPVCAPSRSTMVTGQYPMKLGTHQMRSTLLHPPRLFTHELRDAGYHVSWPTKLDFNFEPTSGWRDDDEPWVDRLRTNAMPDRPWFAYVNLAITHESSMWPDVGEYAHREGLEHWDPNRPRPPRVTDPDGVPVPSYLPDTPVVRGDIARHADNIAELDRQVGQILDALDVSGQAGNTVVVFLADHGRGLPREKRWPYTAGIHMPLLVSWPGVIEPGSVSDRLVSWVDLAPTFCSIAGAAIPAHYDGSAFLGAAEAPPREHVFAARDRMDESFDLVRVVRDRRFHYVRNFFPQIPYCQRNVYMENMPTMQELRRLNAAGELHGSAAIFMSAAKPAEELYDVRTDPECVHNLADDPDHADVRARMAAELERFLASIDDLGAYPERDLVAKGLVADRIEEFRARLAPLPPEYQRGYPMAVLDPADLPPF